jgi:hypothetical protein
MNSTTATTQFQDTRIAGLIHSVRVGNPLLWRTVVAMLAGSILLFAFQLVDQRLINGISVWDKPAKFFLSLAVQYGTVSWALNLLPDADRLSRGIQRAVYVMLFSGWVEMAYIVFRASHAEPSHFNTSTPIASIVYGIMGVGAVSLTVTAAFIGWQILRRPHKTIWQEAAGLGLVLGSVLGTIAGAYMSSHTGHWVGGVQSDANGLAFFNWSTTGGDLRVAHFVGLHAAQFIALSALSNSRAIIYITAIATAALTGILFVVAASGIPLFIP